MNEIRSVVHAQTEALTSLLEKARTEYRDARLAEAREQAGSYVRKAWRTAKQRVRRAVAEERQRLERQTRLAEAEAETEQRRRARQRDIELIRAGWQALEPELRQRWDSPDGRREWVMAALEEASDVLLSRSWDVEHPADWDEDERRKLAKLASDRLGVKVNFAGRGDLTAGVRVMNGTTLVDMSLEGLLSHRRAVEAELLAEVRRDKRTGSGDDNE